MPIDQNHSSRLAPAVAVAAAPVLAGWAGKAALCVLVLAALLLSGCDGGSVTYRYRMTVYVDTPAGPRSGSSVIEVVSSPPAPMGSYQDDVRGEAVAVDLPAGTLFAMLKSPNSESAAGHYAPHAHAAALPDGSDWRARLETLKRQTAPAALPAEYLPTFIRFRDPADPRTAEALDPANLAAGFGSGVRLNRVVIQITEDPVTSTIESRLPNFSPGSGYAEWVGTLRYDDPRRLSNLDFRRGF
jgi:hypothetical protein